MDNWQRERGRRFLEVLTRPKKNPNGICLCGCGQKTTNLDRQYIYGHNHIGKPMSAEAKAKLIKANMGRIGYWKGKKRPPQSIEARKKMSDASIGRVYPYKDTKPEKLLQQALTKLNLKFEKHYHLFGRPDIVFPKKKIAIFIDGDYWHANPKIYNENHLLYAGVLAKQKWQRDFIVNLHLIKNGWRVLRFWENEINGDADLIANEIKKELE